MQGDLAGKELPLQWMGAQEDAAGTRTIWSAEIGLGIWHKN